MHKVATAIAFRLLALIALLTPSTSVLAQTTINVPGDQPTIQAAINVASDGDKVLIAPGTYVENIDFLGKAITVTSSGGAANTILDGGATGPAVTFQSSEGRTAVLSGMTIQNGGGYGVNTTSPGIAGVVVSYASPTIQNNIITQNQCWDIEILYGAPLIQANTISSTQSPPGGCGPGSGAGIYVGGNFNGDASTSSGTPPVIDGNTIEDITIPAEVEQSDGFTNLDTENGGAGIAVFAGSPLIENNILRNNSAPGGNGGAINITGGSGSTIAQNLIYGNSAGCGGGAISFGDIYAGSKISLLAANNTIVDNTGGSADLYSSCGNASQIYGVNFGLSGPNVVFVNNIVSGNTAAPAISCFSLPSASTEQNQPIFDHNLLYNAGGSFCGPTCIDVSTKNGNVSAAPQFANAAQDDFHLLAASPGIDSGNNSALGNIFALSGTTLATDFDGNPRVQDATGLGYPVIDIGAYERAGPVDGTPTTITLTSSVASGTPGEPLLLTALVQSALGVPSGSLTFFLDGQPVGAATISIRGYATLNSVVPGIGTHSLYAAYAGASPGAGSFTAARSVIILVTGVGTPANNGFPTTLEFGANINPQTAGQGATFTAIVSSTDPNTAFVPSPITLTLANGAVLAELTPNQAGTARFTTTTLPIGQDIVTASYAGDATHQPATASFTEFIEGVSGSFGLYCSPMTITVGQTAGLTVNLSAVGGTVIFRDDGTIFGEVPVVTGTVNWTYVGRSVGTHSIAAIYPAYGANAGESAICYVPFQSHIPPAIIVVGLPTTSVLSVQPAAAIFQTTRTLTATVSPTISPGLGTPTGTVSFLNGTNPLGTATLAGGVATLNTIALPVGTDPVTCTYSGDSIYASSDCNTVGVSTSIAQPVLTVTSSANPAIALTPVTFTVQLTATGQEVPMRPVVTVSVAGQNFPLTLDSDGTASVVLSTLMPGTYPVTASFAGNANLLSASASLTETVTTSASMTALSAAPSPGYVGQPVTLTAMVTAPDTLVPTGATVTFYDGTTVLGMGTLDQSRSAIFTTSALAIGTHALTASYPGTSVFTGSISPVTEETILASSFTIALSPTTITVTGDQAVTVAIQLASIGGFAGPLALSYGTLPVNLTANILPPTVMLTTGGSGSATLNLNTAAPTATAMNRSSPQRGIRWSAALAAGLVLLLPRRKRLLAGRRGVRLFLWLALTAALLQTVTGCGNSFYTLPSVAPGTYQIPVTATDVNQNKQTATLTLVVSTQKL